MRIKFPLDRTVRLYVNSALQATEFEAVEAELPLLPFPPPPLLLLPSSLPPPPMLLLLPLLLTSKEAGSSGRGKAFGSR